MLLFSPQQQGLTQRRWQHECDPRSPNISIIVLLTRKCSPQSVSIDAGLPVTFAALKIISASCCSFVYFGVQTALQWPGDVASPLHTHTNAGASLSAQCCPGKGLLRRQSGRPLLQQRTLLVLSQQQQVIIVKRQQGVIIVKRQQGVVIAKHQQVFIVKHQQVVKQLLRVIGATELGTVTLRVAMLCCSAMFMS